MTTIDKVERLGGTIPVGIASVRSTGTAMWNAERNTNNPLKTLNSKTVARGTMQLLISIVPFHPSY